MFSPEEIAQAEAALEQVKESWLKRENVTAVDLGFKWSEGGMTSQLAIRVHITRKKPLADLSDDEIFPTEIDGVPIDVLESTYGLQGVTPEGDIVDGVQAENTADGAMNRQRFASTIPIGASVSNPNTSAGTIGVKVFDKNNNTPMILSNWHVLVGQANPTPATAVWQPGRVDGGTQADKIGALARYVIGPYDAAVAVVSGAREVIVETAVGTPITDLTDPTFGMVVWKMGRTTGYTEGMIDGMKMSLDIPYPEVGVRRLENVFRVVPLPSAPNTELSLGGDSGSAWIDKQSGKAVGLHFAGEIGNDPEQALAHELQPVLDFLGVFMPDQRPAPVPTPEPDPNPTKPTDLRRGDIPTRPASAQPSLWQQVVQMFRRLFGG